LALMSDLLQAPATSPLGKCPRRLGEPQDRPCRDGEEKASAPDRVRVILRLTVCQSVRLGVEPNLGLVTRCCFPLEG
jgi:hypothetical protein